MLDLKKNTVAEWMLKQGYTEVTPMDFYRDIYPEEVLRADNKGSAKDEGMGRVQIVVHSNKKVMGSNEKGYAKPFFKDLSGLKRAIDKSNETYELLEAAGDENFSVLCMLNPCTYYGKKTEAVYMYEVLALVVEIDSILGTEAAGDPPDRQDFRGLSNMFKQMRSVYMARTNTVREPLLPSPTYIICSGHGVHLYYLFDEPIRVNRAFIPEQYNTLNSYKLALMRCIWNESSMITKKKLELQSINQRYRTVGTPTKNGSVCRAFRFGDKVSVNYMNSFCKRLKYTDPDTKQLVCAPEIYRLKPKTGGPTGKTVKYQKPYPRYGTMHRGAYDKALERIKYFAKEGLRYRMLYCLAATARMCHISEDELKQDAYSLLDFLDSKTESPDNRFTSYDIECALRNYSYPGPFMSRTTYEQLCHVECPAPTKKNGRSKAEHMEYMRQRRKEMAEQGLIDDMKCLNWWPTFAYRLLYPKGRKTDCIKESGSSKPTVYKYWSLIDDLIEQDAYCIETIYEAVQGHSWQEILAGNLEFEYMPIKEYAYKNLKIYGLLDQYKKK